MTPSGWNAIWGAGDQCVSLSNVRALDADASYEITPVWSASRGFVIGGGGVQLPQCNDGQNISYVAGALACVDTIMLPHCNDGQTIGYAAGALACLAT